MTETPNTTTTSERFKLDAYDLGKALVIAILTPVLLIIQQSLDAGTMTFNWKQICMAAIAGGVGYLIKNFLTPSQTILK